MEEIDLSRIERRLGSKYKLVVAVARRAQQLRDGARPLVACESKNPISIALREIAEKEVLVDQADLIAEPTEGGDLVELFSSMDDEDMGDLEDFIVGEEDDEELDGEDEDLDEDLDEDVDEDVDEE